MEAAMAASPMTIAPDDRPRLAAAQADFSENDANGE
jgi:hypothetical protein